MFDTIKLDPATWDLTLDGHMDIAKQAQSEAIAQDVASVLKTFQGECWYDSAAGIPYFAQILGKVINTPLFAHIYNNAARTVPNVEDVRTTFTGITTGRRLSGTVSVIDTYGKSINAHF